MIDSLPQYRAHLSRHGHNLNHKFDFTSSTGHLLTLFSTIMNPKETISGKIDMFSRTQPLNSPSHVDIDTYIDYFFVPLDMLYSGFGDSLYQTNEPYSSMIKISPNTLPLMYFSDQIEFSDFGFFKTVNTTAGDFHFIDFNVKDFYGCDSRFLSFYRNFFHNFINPNFIFADFDNVTSKQFALPADFFQPNILPLDLMAYNCVYENFYRLDEREVFDNSIYNIDHCVFENENIFYTNFAKFSSIKYRPLGFDYFTSAKVAPLINGINIRGNESNTDLKAVNNYLNSINVSLVDRQNSQSPLLSPTGGTALSGNAQISTSGLRSMFAVEKILSITGRSKKTYDAQVMAHLGVDVPRDVKHEISYIGTQKGSIKIGEIIAVAGTSDTPLGDMAGKGYGAMSNKGIKFTAPCHGIFIAIYSAVPKLSYYAPLEKAHCITSRLDFWHPEFEKLGMQPIFGFEVAPLSQSSFRSNICGWQMRYEQYKRKFDKVSPAFANTLIDFGGVDPQTYQPEPVDYRSETFNTWKNWVLSIRPFRQVDNGYPTAINRFLSRPTDLNDIMSLTYGWFNDTVDVSDPTTIPDYWKFQLKSKDFTPIDQRSSFGWNVASLFYRDPLLHFANIDFKLVSSMGENTLPDLNM